MKNKLQIGTARLLIPMCCLISYASRPGQKVGIAAIMVEILFGILTGMPFGKVIPAIFTAPMENLGTLDNFI